MRSWGWDPATVRVEAQSVEAGTAEAARDAAARGRRLRALATARRDPPHFVRVDLAETAPGDPLHALAGPEKAAVLGCPEAGDVVVSGGRSSPLGAALAMIKDALEVTVARSAFG
jgi:homoserine dehydrogenase